MMLMTAAKEHGIKEEDRLFCEQQTSLGTQ
jgi:hypothetical protein